MSEALATLAPFHRDDNPDCHWGAGAPCECKVLRPLSDRVIIKPDDILMTRPSGLIYSTKYKLNYRKYTGTVVAVGPGKLNKDGSRTPVEVCVGDHVAFGKFCGQEIVCYGVSYLVVHVDDLLGGVEEGEYAKE